MMTHGDNRRARANAVSNRRASTAKARMRKMNTTGWAALFDYARGRAWWVPERTFAALMARGFVTIDGEVTIKGYDALLIRRGDPIANLPDAEVVDYYHAMHDAPAWPVVTP